MQQPGAPAVIVHGARDVSVACTAARQRGTSLTLLSAPGAAGTLGALWWSALVEAARDAATDLAVADLLDCGQAPGRVQEALRCGLRQMILAPCPGFAPLAALTAELGGQLYSEAPPALDLGQPNALRSLAAWFGCRSERPGAFPP